MNKQGRNKAKSRNYRQNTRPQEDVNSAKGRVDKVGVNKFNDVSWYARNPQLLRDAGSLSFNNPLGAQLRFNDVIPANSTFQAVSGMDVIPGVMRISFRPVPGVSRDNSSPVNIAARNIYSFVRHANSGHTNYDSPDLMLYLLAMDNLYMMFNLGKRAYGLARYYSQYNRYVPDELIVAAGFDPADLRRNLANLRYGLNVIAAKLNAFAVPNSMTLFTRHSWMVSNVYKDADEPKAQLYLWTPSEYFVYNETGSPRGGYLQITTNQLWKVEEYLESLNVAVAAVVESEDLNIMSGDILKAYGTGKLWTLGPIGEEYAIEPVYNVEVLNQMHNTTMFYRAGTQPWTTRDNIRQDPDTGAILCGEQQLTPFVSNAAGAHQGFPIMINMPRGDVTPDMVMVATRNTTQLRISDAADVETVNIDSMGSEMITGFTIYTKELDSSTANTYTVLPFNSIVVIPTSGSSQVTMAELVQISNFDWHPILYLTTGDTFVGYLGDISNNTLIDANTLEKLHSTALLSELDVPVSGSI
nr:putative capsid [Marmot picobirnavirus]